MTNYEHMQKLPPPVMADVLMNISENMCLCCPKERERRCNENCSKGLKEWLLLPYIPGSVIWKRRNK